MEISNLNKSYTDYRNAVKPPRSVNQFRKVTRKKISREFAQNYDAFDLNKLPTLGQVTAPARPFEGPPGSLPHASAPVYIGQNVYVRPSYIVTLAEYSGTNKYKSAAFLANQENLKERLHLGKLSHKAVGKLRNSINWLVCAADPKTVYSKKSNSYWSYKVGFITLTLPDTAKEVSDFDFKTKLLNPWLTLLRSYHGLKNYVWKLEFQKNGKLHCHITFDIFIHHAVLRKTWNTILGHNNLLVDFYNKFGHANPNSTDVHSVKKIANLAAYLSKYMSKNSEDLARIKGRIWGCNQEISKANTTKLFVDRDATHYELKPLFSKNIPFQAIGTADKDTGIFRKFGEVFFLKYENWLSDISGSILESFHDTILELKNVASDQSAIYQV